MNIVAVVIGCAPSEPPGNVVLYLQVCTEVSAETGMFEPCLLSVELDFDHIHDDGELQRIMEAGIRERMEKKLGHSLLPGDHLRILGTSYRTPVAEPSRAGFWRGLGRRLGPPDHKLVTGEIIG